MQLPPSSSLRHPVVAALLIVLLAHSPIVICDTVLWDSAVLKYSHDSGQYDALRLRASKEGSPHVAELHIAIGRLPYFWRAYRLIAYGCLAIATIGIYLVVSSHTGLSRNEAAAVSALSLLFPTFVLWQEPIIVMQAMCIAIFWMTWAWRLRQLKSEAAHPLAASVAAVLFLFSFCLESLLVLHYVVLLYCFFAPGTVSFKDRAVAFVRRNWLFAMLPPIFYVAKRMVSPTHSQYAEYNTIRFDEIPLLAMKGFLVNAKRMLLDQGLDFVRFFREEPAFLAPLSVVACAASVACVRWFFPSPSSRISIRAAAASLGFAVVAYFAATFPYAVVNKFPLVNSYNSRHAVLIFVPLSAAFLIALRSLTSRRGVIQISFGLALAALFILTLRDHVLWQNRYVKYLGVLEHLRGSESRLASTVVVKDAAAFGMPETLRPFELNWIMYNAWNDRRHLGFDAVNFSSAELKRWEGLDDQKATMYRDYHYDGRISRVTILPGRSLSELRIYGTYFWSSHAERVDLARSLVQLQIEPAEEFSEP